LGIAENVTFPGRVNAVTALLQSASLAIHPSEGEVGYSLSILEYMLSGSPTVVPNNPYECGATKHNDTGWIYPEGDVDAAAKIINSYLLNRSVGKMVGQRAREAVQAEFSQINTHSRLIHVFDIYLSSRKS